MRSPRVREGAAWLLGAQVVFFASGYALNAFLGRRLGPAEYGLYGVVLFATNMIRTFVSSGIPMAVTRYVSAEPTHAEAVYRSGFRTQLPLAIAVSLLFFLLAKPISLTLGDERLTALFRAAAPITIFFGLFFLIFQYYNGLKSYRRQSILLAGSYVLRAALGILLVVLGFGVLGVIHGIVLASLIAWIWAAWGRRGASNSDTFSAGTLIRFSIPLIIAAVVQALLTDLDIMFVKRLVPGEGSAGLYTSAKSLAQMTPIAFYALSSALYPAVSAAFSAGNKSLLTRYVHQANRLLLATVLPLVVLVFCNSAAILKLVYGSAYLPAAGTLGWLTLSYGLLAVFIIHKTIITGCGYPRAAGLMTLILLPLFGTLQMLMIPLLGLEGSAQASTLTFALGVLASIIFLRVRLNAGINLASIWRILMAVGAMFIADRVLAYYLVPIMPKMILLVLLYLGFLRLTGELYFRISNTGINSGRDSE